MDILMPQLGETVAEGTVTRWYKQVGEAVQADEALFDVETDKVSTEIPSPVSGVLAEVLVPAGQTVRVGTRLAVVRSVTDEAKTAAPVRADAHARLAVASAQAGAQKSAARPDSRTRGNGEAAFAPAPSGASMPARRDPRQRLSPVVRRLVAEHGLDPASIRGSGRDGRVTRDDVLNHLARSSRATLLGRHPGEARAELSLAGGPQSRDEAAAPAPPVHAEPQARSPLPTGQERPLADGEHVVALNGIRRRSAAAMARAWQVVPHVLQAVEADYSRIMQARNAKQAAWQAAEGFALTCLPFLAWAVCQALQRYAQLNARIEGDNLIVSRRVHLGIAVDLDHEGLVVPVIRDAQDRTVPALAREIRRLALGARASRLGPDDFAQPTYTISNSGVFGTLITAPIVNPPQVAILSTDGVSKRPVVVESAEGDSIAVRPVGVLAQSFDHRAIDGAYSAAFLQELKRIVETRAWVEDIA